MDHQKMYRPYTPARQDAGFLERTTSGRQELLSDLLAGIKSQSSKPTHQHWLLIGPRGIGKSHIISLVRERVRDEKVFATWLPVWFPEEAAGIITLRDFMEKVIGLAVKQLQEEGLAQEVRRFREMLEGTRNEGDDQRAINRLRSLLMDWKNERRRKILVLLENAHRVLGNRVAKSARDEKWLRDLLMNRDLFLLIATSPTYFKQVVNKDHPLYELFRIEILEDLNLDQSRELLIRYAKEEGREDLVKEFRRDKGHRIQAIHELAGGNPRLLVMFYVLVQDSVANIRDLEFGFFNLLEELTPYFQARTGQLGDQEEKVLVAFAEGPELLTPAEVGRNIRMPTNLVTANLKRLQSAGFVRRIEKPVKGRKGTLYQLAETIYRYWYQMNSERSRGPAEILIRFITLWYTQREVKQMYTTASGGGATRYLQAAVGILKKEKSRYWTLLRKAEDEKRPPNEIGDIYKQILEQDPEDIDAQNKYGIFLCETGAFEEGIKCFRETLRHAQAMGNDKYQRHAYNNWGIALTDLASLKSDEALFRESFEKYSLAVKYKEDKHESYYNWGTALSELARWKGEEALFRESFEKYSLAVKYKEDMHTAYCNWANSLSDLAELKGDEALFRDSFEKYSSSWNIIKFLETFDHPLMINTGLIKALLAFRLEKADQAEETLSEVLGSLSRVSSMKPVVPYFLDFFILLAREGGTALGQTFLSQLLQTSFKKELSPITPLKILFEYLDKRDVAILRRQPPEVRKILNEMIEKIENEKD